MSWLDDNEKSSWIDTINSNPIISLKKKKKRKQHNFFRERGKETPFCGGELPYCKSNGINSNICRVVKKKKSIELNRLQGPHF